MRELLLENMGLLEKEQVFEQLLADLLAQDFDPTRELTGSRAAEYQKYRDWLTKDPHARLKEFLQIPTEQVRELKETVLATQATIAKAQATVSKTIDGAQAVLAPGDCVK